MNLDKPVVFYHANCTDGFGAAFIAWTVFKNDAEYIPIKYGTINSIDDFDLLGKIEGREVFILDFSFPKEVMERIFNTAEHTTWLDHHKTAFEMWCPEQPFHDESRYVHSEHNVEIHLNNKHSGAMIAWQFFADDSTPMLIKHIDDYDRWQFKLPGTKAFNRALRAKQPWTFEQWNEDFFWVEQSPKYEELIELGQLLLDEHEGRVKSATKYSRKAIFSFSNYHESTIYIGLAVNAAPDLASDAGHVLAVESNTFGMTYQIDNNLRVKVSLRSNGNYDVSAIAKQYGGGGHKNAAGCEMTIAQLTSVLGGGS